MFGYLCSNEKKFDAEVIKAKKKSVIVEREKKISKLKYIVEQGKFVSKINQPVEDDLIKEIKTATQEDWIKKIKVYESKI